MKKRTKIVATIGPASDSIDNIIELIYAGVDVFRLNFSHGTHEHHKEILDKIRQAEKETSRIVGVLQDISGPKIRVGHLKEPFHLVEEDIIELVKESIDGEQVSDNLFRASISQPSILGKINEGEYIYFSDGTIRTKVIEVTENKVRVQVENAGILMSKKGINFPNTALGINIITQKDEEDIAWGIKNGIDFMAISFVQNAGDMIQVRDLIKGHEDDIKLFAKIEKFDAVENIDEILKQSDGIMVARGDLGIEIPFFEVPATQKMLIKKANEASKPVITATQMLLSMTENERATRAEISDIANAVLDGTDAVMLSEESAVGHNPALAVRTMVQAIVGAEKVYPFNKLNSFNIEDATDSLESSAVSLSRDISARGIISLTASGNSVKKLSRYKPDASIYAVTHRLKIARFLTITWGVSPAFLVKEGTFREMLSDILDDGIQRGVLFLDKKYIVTASDPFGLCGSTNMIMLLGQREMLHSLHLR
jgi:pyruvate kinase